MRSLSINLKYFIKKLIQFNIYKKCIIISMVYLLVLWKTMLDIENTSINLIKF